MALAKHLGLGCYVKISLVRSDESIYRIREHWFGLLGLLNHGAAGVPWCRSVARNAQPLHSPKHVVFTNLL